MKNSILEGTFGVESFLTDFLVVDSFLAEAYTALGVFLAEAAGCESTPVGSAITCSISGSGATTSISLGFSRC